MERNRAFFFDRDGVINDTEVDWENKKSYAPRNVSDLKVFPEAVNVIKNLKKNFLVIVVSNQPDIALGKIDENTKRGLEDKFIKLFEESGVVFDDIYYCYHHENSINSDYPPECDCRKPKPGMIIMASEKHNIDLENSFVVGDTWRDIEAGKNAGCRTILLRRHWSLEEKCNPDFVIENIEQILDIVNK